MLLTQIFLFGTLIGIWWFSSFFMALCTGALLFLFDKTVGPMLYAVIFGATKFGRVVALVLAPLCMASVSAEFYFLYLS